MTGRLLLATLGALAVFVGSALAVSLVLSSLDDQGQASREAEVLADVIAVSKLSEKVASAASMPTSVGMTPESIAGARAAVADSGARLAARLLTLEGQGYGNQVGRLSQQVDLLVTNASLIEDQRHALLEAVLAGQTSWQQLLFSTNQKLLPAISSSLDNQFYYIMTGKSEFRDTEDSGSALSEDEFLRYWHLATLLEASWSAHRSLLAANLSSQDDPTRLAGNEESFDTAAQRIKGSVAYLAENGGLDLNPEVVPLSNRLLAAGAGESGALNAMRLRASLVDRERELIAANRQILAQLQKEVDSLVEEIRESSAREEERYRQAVSDGRLMIVVTAVIGVVGALLVAVYIRRRWQPARAGLVVGYLGVVAIVISVAVAGRLVIDNLEPEHRGNAQLEIMAAAADIAGHAGTLGSTVSLPTSSQMTPQTMAGATAAFAEEAAKINDGMSVLVRQGYDQQVAPIGRQIDLLTANASKIDNGRTALLDAILTGEKNWQDLSLSTNFVLLPAISSSLDNQYHYMMTGRSDTGRADSAGTGGLSEEEFLRFWHMATLVEAVSRGYWTLDFANRLTVPALAARVEETFDSAAQRMERSIEYLGDNGGPELSPEVIPLSSRLLNAGIGENSALDAMKLRTAMVAGERRLIRANGQILATLQGEVDALVAEVRQSLETSPANYNRAVSNGRVVIWVIAAVGIVGALSVAGYSVFGVGRANRRGQSESN